MSYGKGGFTGFASSLVALAASAVVAACSSAPTTDGAERVASTRQAVTTFPTYDHVFVVISENHKFDQIIGNPAAPIINSLAASYGLATQYTGVSDPSEPNYVAMLGGSDFGIASDDPYFFPGQTVNADNLMSQLEAAGKTWRAYFQDFPYPGYRGFCFPGKCNGIPDSDTEYVAKHNGIVNFANMQNAADFARQMPLAQLSDDLASGDLPNFGYVVADECHDMHGAPPYCVDSGNPGDVADNWLVATGDAFIGDIVGKITSSSAWKKGNNAIVLTWDEGDAPSDVITTIVVTSHGPRGVQDPTPYSHYSLLASLEQTFGLGCLLNSCTANLMTPLFQVTGANDVAPIPPGLIPAPDGTNAVSPTGAGAAGPVVHLHGKDWSVVPPATIGTLDHNLAAVSAGSADDVWAVGSFLPPSGDGTVLQTLGEHFDGKRWTAFPLPDVGPNINALFGVSVLPSSEAWAVGYFVDASFHEKTLVEHFDGATWTVVPAPSPGGRQNILYGVAAKSSSDVWAIGGFQDDNDLWHPLAIHWDGSRWTRVPAPEPGATGNIFYAITTSCDGTFVTGQQAGTAFPGKALVEQWDGGAWRVVPTPRDPGGTDITLGIAAGGSNATIVGDRESSTAPYTTLVASGDDDGLRIVTTPNVGAGENDLFAATTADDGSTWAVGWLIDPASGNHLTLTEHGIKGSWAVVTSPNPNASAGDDGLSSVTSVPGGGGLWAVGVTTNADGNNAPLILHRP
jgi:Phosphoesterase family